MRTHHTTPERADYAVTSLAMLPGTRGPAVLRHLLECLHCVRADPDAEHGHFACSRDLDDARRLMRNHLAQQHDILPTRQEPLTP